MRCSSRSAPARIIGARPRQVQALAIAFVLALAVAVASSSAYAQSPTPPTPTPTPTPSPTPTVVSSYGSSGAAVTNLGSSFLERLGNQASSGFGSAMRKNPGGGGASEAGEPPRFRSWAEAYGISARTGAQGDFVGDRRRTWGGVLGIGARVMPGVNIGVSVDQSQTAIDVPLALQSARLDLTQIGFNYFEALGLKGIVQMNLFRDHALAFDEFARIPLARKTADNLVRFLRIARPMHLRSTPFGVSNKLT